MKTQCNNKSILLSGFLFFTCTMYSDFINAQFLKKIVNTVKQTTQNRANDKANDATNKAIDKIGSGTQTKSNNNSADIDTTAFGGVLGAFAKAAKDNPNDTSGADLTMKALGNLTGRGGVSAADSANAIKTFMTANGGSGTYYEYAVEATSKQAGTTKSTTKMYLTANGEARLEMNLAAMMGIKNAADLITISRADKPQYSVTLVDVNKMYSLNVIDTALIGSRIGKNEVTKIGNENVQGYNCIHSKLVSTTGSGMFKSSTTEDIWTSTDVPGYATFKKAMLQNVTPAMMKALDDAGCGGFFVKIISGDKDNSMTMLLTKAQKQSFPASMFKIPGSYAESKSNLMFGNMMQAAQKQ